MTQANLLCVFVICCVLGGVHTGFVHNYARQALLGGGLLDCFGCGMSLTCVTLFTLSPELLLFIPIMRLQQSGIDQPHL